MSRALTPRWPIAFSLLPSDGGVRPVRLPAVLQVEQGGAFGLGMQLSQCYAFSADDGRIAQTHQGERSAFAILADPVDFRAGEHDVSGIRGDYTAVDVAAVLAIHQAPVAAVPVGHPELRPTVLCLLADARRQFSAVRHFLILGAGG